MEPWGIPGNLGESWEAPTTSVMIELEHKASLDAVSGPTNVYHTLRAHAASSQMGVVDVLQEHDVDFDAFYVANAVFARNSVLIRPPEELLH